LASRTRTRRQAHYDGIVAFSQTDFTEDLKAINVPVLVMHGDDDQIAPYADSAPLSAKLLKNGILKTCKGFPHRQCGLVDLHQGLTGSLRFACVASPK
jgi:pimeloyl-ACP methyl ester carboxylesterase